VVTLRVMPSGAMEPTVPLGSRVVVDKAAFRLTGLHHGDLFVLWMGGPHGQRFSLVSRLIGLPGDRIECRDGAVLRNGTAISEPYVMADSITDCAPHVVADGTVYVLSDHRRAAMDSRRGGAVPIDDLVGRVILTL
jgi:signal peptidase I